MRTCRMLHVLVASLLALVAGEPAHAQDASSDDSSLGTVDFTISCSKEAQAVFNSAVVLLHHMTYPLARKRFEDVAELDPDCAMAYWGASMTLFQPLWPTRPGPSQLREGRVLVRKADSLSPPTERERLFVASADSFFRNPGEDDYWKRIHRWHRGVEDVYRQFPLDHESAAFLALSLLATAPAGGGQPEHQQRAAELLLWIHEKNGRHPGALHYLIHANDVQGRQGESLDLVRSYDDIAPQNPHALHMPTHIYTRLGDWDAVIEGNLRAAEAALLHPAGDDGQYVWDEFPHALEYLVYAYLQLAEDSLAMSQLIRLQSTGNLHPTFKTAFHVSSIPARYALERKDWKGAAALSPRPLESLDWDQFRWPEAITWFARSLGSSKLGQLDDARAAHDRLVELERMTLAVGEELFARQIRILQLEAAAWIAQAEGGETTALAMMREAAQLEVSTPKHPVTPAPTLPAYELFGELWLEQQQPDSALAAAERSLSLNPRRLNGLLLAARAAREVGDEEAARRFYSELTELAGAKSQRVGLTEAREYLEEPVGCTARDSLTVRNAHAMAYDEARGLVVLFGGADDRQVLGDLWAWDGSVWRCLSSEGPPPRTFPSLAYDGEGRLVLFGGNRVLFGTEQDTTTFLDDMWTWDGSGWREVITSTPSARAEAAVAYDAARKRIVLFGGYRNDRDHRIRLGDTWEWDGQRWEGKRAAEPSPRNGAAMAYDSDRKRVVLFGGSGNSGDTWEWDGQEWMHVASADTTPRFNSAMAFDGASKAVVRFGGWTRDGRVGDMWTYDGISWTKVDGESPPPRNHTSIVYDNRRATLVLFGGHDGDSVLGDTWEWNGQWARRTVHAPRQRVDNGH